jgi:hypothetical protein
MILPKLYQIKTQEQKRKIVIEIANNLKRISNQHYPNIASQLENDNAKVNLIDRFICNMYGSIGGAGSWIDTIDSIEVTID